MLAGTPRLFIVGLGAPGALSERWPLCNVSGLEARQAEAAA